MGPLFVLPILILIATFIGFILGGLIGGIAFPIYYKIRKIPPGNQQPKTPVRILIFWLSIFLGIMTNFFAVAGIDLVLDHNYELSTGIFDTFRWPLEYPYEMVTGGLSQANIRSWDKSPGAVSMVTKYYKSGKIIIGQRESDPFFPFQIKENKKWFIFDCSNGDTKYFASFEELKENLDDYSISEDFKLEPISEYYSRHFSGQAWWRFSIPPFFGLLVFSIVTFVLFYLVKRKYRLLRTQKK